MGGPPWVRHMTRMTLMKLTVRGVLMIMNKEILHSVGYTLGFSN